MTVPYVFYPQQIFGGSGDSGVAMGAYKARDVRAHLPSDFLVSENPKMVTVEEALTVHSEEFIQSVLKGSTGFGRNKPFWVDPIRYAAGNFLRAANIAKEDGIAMSLSSGFHHAGYDYCWGYCTINALMIAAVLHIRDDDWDGRPVLILDGDAHLGDGCISIIQKLKLTEDQVKYVSVPGPSSPSYQNDLDRELSLILNETYGMVIYQPGADSLKEDLMGSGSLTQAKFFLRDAQVFSASRDSNTPIVFNLAGGYGAPSYEDTILTHVNSWKTASEIYS